MATIVQYFPAFFSGTEPKRIDFNSTDELLDIPFVRTFSMYSENVKDKYFYRYSLSTREGGETKLMAEINDGKSWYVIGRIDDVSNLTLPEWVPVYDEDIP